MHRQPTGQGALVHAQGRNMISNCVSEVHVWDNLIIYERLRASTGCSHAGRYSPRRKNTVRETRVIDSENTDDILVKTSPVPCTFLYSWFDDALVMLLTASFVLPFVFVELFRTPLKSVRGTLPILVVHLLPAWSTCWFPAISTFGIQQNKGLERQVISSFVGRPLSK